VIKLLVERGANIQVKNTSGRTPLHVAAYNLNAGDAVSYLIEKGADVNARDSTGETPLRYALESGSHPAIEILRAHGGVE
jgi:ankyrin repeat protein